MKLLKIFLTIVAISFTLHTLEVVTFLFIRPVSKFTIIEPNQLISGVEVIIGIMALCYLFYMLIKLIGGSNET